eukprot:958091-Prorocentrum_minimum.AAC.1
MPSSFSLLLARTLRSVVSHSSVSSAILCFSCAASRVRVALSRRLSARWSSAVLTDALSMLCSTVFSSSWAVSCTVAVQCHAVRQAVQSGHDQCGSVRNPDWPGGGRF